MIFRFEIKQLLLTMDLDFQGRKKASEISMDISTDHGIVAIDMHDQLYNGIESLKKNIGLIS